MEEYCVIAFNESTRKFIRRYIDANSKSRAMDDFERYYENCTVVNIIEL